MSFHISNANMIDRNVNSILNKCQMIEVLTLSENFPKAAKLNQLYSMANT